MRYKKGDKLILNSEFPSAVLNGHIGELLYLTMKTREFVIVDRTIDYEDGTQTIIIRNDGKGMYHSGPISSKRFKRYYENLIPDKYFEID